MKHQLASRRADLGEKRDAYLTIPSLKVLIHIEPEVAVVTVRRRRPDGGFAQERYVGLDAVVALPEVEAALPPSGLYERTSVGAP